jgi:hypothetical protein
MFREWSPLTPALSHGERGSEASLGTTAQTTDGPPHGLRPVMICQYPVVGLTSTSTKPASLSMLE